MNLIKMREIIALVEFEGYRFNIAESRGSIYLQAQYEEPDIVTKRLETQFTRKWLLSPKMTKSELVQTCFKLVMTSMEHRTREGFLYRGKRIFGPHFNVDALHQICSAGRFDVRR